MGIIHINTFNSIIINDGISKHLHYHFIIYDSNIFCLQFLNKLTNRFTYENI